MDENPFVKANEGIAATARELAYDRALPLFCECPDPHCRQFVRMSIDEYDAVRSPPWQPITLPGHEHPDSAVA